MNKKLILSIMFGMVFLFGILPMVSSFDWNDGMEAYYKLDEFTGTSSNDEAGTNDLILANSGLWQGGRINYAIGNNATTYWANSTNNIGTGITNLGYAVSFWTYFMANTSYQVLIATDDAGGNDACEFYIGSYSTLASNNWMINFNNQGNTQLNNVHPQLNEWTHWVGTYTNGEHFQLYKNGVWVGNSTLTVSGCGLGNITDKLYLFRQSTDNGITPSTQVIIDEVGLWSRPLNTTDITELYNSGSGLPFSVGGGSNFNINLYSPTNASIITSAGANFTTNLSMSGTDYDYEWKNATYNVWFSNGTLFNSTIVTGLSGNQTNISQFIDSFILGNYKWNVYGCYDNSTLGNCTWSSGNFTFQYSPFAESTVSFNNSVLETSGQNYILNITSIDSVSAIVASLIYNGTEYASTLNDFGSGNYQILNTLDVPLQNSVGNKSFYWKLNFTLTDSSTFLFNSTEYSQEVNRTYLINCNTTYPIQFINFTSKSSENPFPIVNATFKSAWTWYIQGGTGSVTRNYTFEDVTETNSSWAFCGNYNETFVIDSHVEYDGTNYALNSYYLEDASLTNSTNYINLYLLNNTKATATILKVRDNIQNPIEDVLIQIQLYDVGTDAFYTVGMVKTSFNGEDLAYLNWYDSLYKFVLIQNGEVIKFTNTTRIFETPQIFDIVSETTFSYEKFRDFVYSLTYNPLTQNFVLTFTKPSGLVDQGCLRVIKRTAQNDTQISLTCSSSSSATLYSNIGSYGNGTYIATFYATGSWYLLDSIWYKIGSDSFGEQIFDLLGFEDATFYAILFSGIVVVMFLITPAIAIVGMLLALAGAVSLGFAGIDYFIFTGISIIGFVIIWLAKR